MKHLKKILNFTRKKALSYCNIALSYCSREPC